MNKILMISAIALIAVVMGFSTIAPNVLPEAEAHENDKQFSEKACSALEIASQKHSSK